MSQLLKKQLCDIKIFAGYFVNSNFFAPLLARAAYFGSTVNSPMLTLSPAEVCSRLPVRES